jgi:ribonuclease PH
MSDRLDGRGPRDLRPVRITPGFLKFPAGSALIECGDTRVICACSIEERVPGFLTGGGRGWVSGEYSMLPGATVPRQAREATQGRVGGRTHEIQRLIGRALRAVTDLGALGERTFWLDCDVIQADGGTRTAAVTGAFVALALALAAAREKGQLTGERLPLAGFVAATSVGLVDGSPQLDLSYEEDARAAVDLNLVGTGGGRIIEVQGTGERASFSRREMDELVSLGFAGIERLVEIQRRTLGALAGDIGPG